MGMMYCVLVLVGVSAVTVTQGAVDSPVSTVTAGGVLVTVVVTSAISCVSCKVSFIARELKGSLLVIVAVVASAVEVVVTVDQCAVFASVTTNGCGSGARSAKRRARASTKRRFSSSSISRLYLALAAMKNGPIVGLMWAAGSRAALVGELQLAVLVTVVFRM